MKGIITLNIEVDYGVMLDSNNQNAIHLFTGAKTVEEMIKIHMDQIGSQLIDVVKDKPLIKYSVDGVLRQEPVEENSETSEEEQEESEGSTDSLELTLEEPEEEKEVSTKLVESLGKAIEYVSLELGIPQKIKVTREMISQIELMSGTQYEDVEVAMYYGFEIEEEGMEESFIIVYKSYNGSDIKFFSEDDWKQVF